MKYLFVLSFVSAFAMSTRAAGNCRAQAVAEMKSAGGYSLSFLGVQRSGLIEWAYWVDYKNGLVQCNPQFHRGTCRVVIDDNTCSVIRFDYGRVRR